MKYQRFINLEAGDAAGDEGSDGQAVRYNAGRDEIDTRVICTLVKTQRVHEHTGLPISDPIPIVHRDRFGRPRRPARIEFMWERFARETAEQEQLGLLLDEELDEHL